MVRFETKPQIKFRFRFSSIKISHFSLTWQQHLVIRWASIISGTFYKLKGFVILTPQIAKTKGPDSTLRVSGKTANNLLITKEKWSLCLMHLVRTQGELLKAGEFGGSWVCCPLYLCGPRFSSWLHPDLCLFNRKRSWRITHVQPSFVLICIAEKIWENDVSDLPAPISIPFPTVV